MTDRLTEIKNKHKFCSSIHYNDTVHGTDPSAIFDMRWLIEQVEKFQKENEKLTEERDECYTDNGWDNIP